MYAAQQPQQRGERCSPRASQAASIAAMLCTLPDLSPGVSRGSDAFQPWASRSWWYRILAGACRFQVQP